MRWPTAGLQKANLTSFYILSHFTWELIDNRPHIIISIDIWTFIDTLLPLDGVAYMWSKYFNGNGWWVTGFVHMQTQGERTPLAWSKSIQSCPLGDKWPGLIVCGHVESWLPLYWGEFLQIICFDRNPWFYGQTQ